MYINARPKKLSLSSILFFVVVFSLTIVTSSLFAATTSITASKSVDNANPSVGSQVEYTIKVKNTGTATVSGVTVTETALPAGLTYVASSSMHSGPSGGYTITPFATVAAPPLTWTINSLAPSAEVTIKYKADVSAAGVLTNSGTVAHSSLGTSGAIISANVTATSAPTSYELYMPIIFKSPPGVTLNAIPYSFGANSWTLSWTPASQSGLTFEVQEDDNASFSSPTTLTTTASSPYTRTGGSSNTGKLYYRVRAIQNGTNGAWSTTRIVSFEYFDTFNSNTGWQVRRAEKSPYARSVTGGNLRVTTDSAWSNVLVSPHITAPGSNYTITTNVLMHQRQDNHHFGIVFGGKHDSGCTATSGLETDCFEDFYLLDVQHRYQSGSSLYDPAIFEIKIDKVEYTSSNAFNRTTIKNWSTTNLDVEDSHEWKIDVNTNGSFSIRVNGTEIRTGTVDDASMLNNGYFGVIVMADQNGSARTDFADFRVKAD